jgi:transposase-like protein
MTKAVQKRGSNRKPPIGVCGALLALKPANLDEKMVRAVVGKRIVKTLAEVAQEFGIQATSLRSSWRVQGMPGKPGRFDLAEVTLWRLQHEADVAERMPGSTAKSQAVELKDLEIRERALVVKERERRDAMAEGNMVEAHKVRSEQTALNTVLRQRLGRVGADIEPMLPAEIAIDIRVEIERNIGRQLKWFAEATVRVLENEVMAT